MAWRHLTSPLSLLLSAGSTATPVQSGLRWGVDVKLADRVRRAAACESAWTKAPESIFG